MDNDFRQLVAEALLRGEDLPREWAQKLFPPEKREYELVYDGKEREEDILAGTMAVPLQPVRTFGEAVDASGDSENAWYNKLIFGDNLQALRRLVEMKQSGELCNADGTPGVRLVYIDPPFGTGDEYGIRNSEIAYSAKLQGVQFISFLRKRLVMLRELLSDNGSIYVRLDYHFGHYIKVIMDEVFGIGNFQNEVIINRFKRQLRGLTKFNVATDVLYYYTKSNQHIFNSLTRSRLCSFCGQEREPQWRAMNSPGLRNPPERTILGNFMLPPKGRHWTFSQKRLAEMEEQGRIRISENKTYIDLNGERVHGVPEYLQTEDTPVDSNWTDLRGYVFGAKYPTQNPEELLARVIDVSSNPGDLVLDAFAGSGTTCAAAEKLGRRWIGIDAGKLAIYTIQKRMLNLREKIGNKGKRLKHKPFTLYNAGLYDFERLRKLPWEDWRFFALQLFECRDDPHTIGGIEFDGKRWGHSALVFNFHKLPGVRVDEDTLREIHRSVGRYVGSRVYIIAPRNLFDFQQDYLILDGVRYYAMRIPYSFIEGLHKRDFAALHQPRDEKAVNDLMDAVGFDFIRPPQVKWEVGQTTPEGKLLPEAYLQLHEFESQAYIRGQDKYGSWDTFSMLILDFDYEVDAENPVFNFSKIFFAHELADTKWQVLFPLESVGTHIMAVFVDIYGNEARVVISRAEFEKNTVGE